MLCLTEICQCSELSTLLLTRDLCGYACVQTYLHCGFQGCQSCSFRVQVRPDQVAERFAKDAIILSAHLFLILYIVFARTTVRSTFAIIPARSGPRALKRPYDLIPARLQVVGPYDFIIAGLRVVDPYESIPAGLRAGRSL